MIEYRFFRVGLVESVFRLKNGLLLAGIRAIQGIAAQRQHFAGG